MKPICTIRLDDITPDMNWERFEKVKEILDNYNIKPLIGVVPNNQDETLSVRSEKEGYWGYLKQLQQQGWAIAQHGYEHCYTTKNSGLLGINSFSEFAGLPYEEQYEKLSEGKKLLEQEGIHTNIFMAPGHTYDDNTLVALEKLGFRYVTDGLSKSPYRYKNIIFLPCRLTSNYRIKGMDTICLHTNHMSEQGREELEQFIRLHRDMIADYDAGRLGKSAKEKTERICLQEKRCLRQRNRKDRLAKSSTVANYMQKTNHTKAGIKLIKRVVYLPYLLLQLLFEKDNDK